jgi:hypothetical protein
MKHVRGILDTKLYIYRETVHTHTYIYIDPYSYQILTV